MTIKPFAIQGSDLTLGGVNLSAGATTIVIPGVTEASNYFVEAVDENGSDDSQDFGSNAGAITIIDNAEYLYLVDDGDSPSQEYVPAEYSVDELDDGNIEEVQIEVAGTFAAADKTRVEAANMWATTTPTPFVSFNTANWTQIPFRPKMRAGAVENVGGGGSTGNFTFNADTIANDNDASIEVVGGSLGNIEVQTVDELVPPGGIWRLFIRDEDYPTLGTTVQIGDTVTTSWGTPITATITDIQQNNGKWQIHVAQDITAGHDGYDTVTFSTVVTTKNWVFGQDGSLTLPNGMSIDSYGTLGENAVVSIGGDDTRITIDNDGAPPGLTITTNATAGMGQRQWRFGPDGDLTFPDGSIQTTAYTSSGAVGTFFVVANASGEVSKSTDGVSWTTGVDLGQDIDRVATDGVTVAMIQSDQLSWTTFAGLESSTYVSGSSSISDKIGDRTISWRQIDYAGGYFVAVGRYTPTGSTLSQGVYGYSTDGRVWTFATVDQTVVEYFGNDPVDSDWEFSDIDYNGVGWMFSVGDDEGPGTPQGGGVYITDLTATVTSARCFSMSITYDAAWNGSAWYMEGDNSLAGVNTSLDPRNGTFVGPIDPWDTDIQDLGIGAGSTTELAGGNGYIAAGDSDGHVAWSDDNGQTWQIVTPIPYTRTISAITQASPAVVTGSGENGDTGEKVIISGSSVSGYNGTFYWDATGNSLYTDQARTTPFDTSGLAPFTGTATLTWSHGMFIDAMDYINGYFYIGNDNEQIARTTNFASWTLVDDQNDDFDFWEDIAGFVNTGGDIGDIVVEVDSEYTKLTLANKDFTLETTRTGDQDADINLFAADDIFIEALGDDIALSAKDQVRINTNSSFDGPGDDNTWTFDREGRIRFPDDTFQTTAYPGDNDVWVQTFKTATGAPADVPLMTTSVEYLSGGDIVALIVHTENVLSGTYSGVARFTSAGELVWSMSFDGALYTTGWGLAVDNANGYIYVAGNSNVGGAAYDVATLTKLNQTDGSEVWSCAYDVGVTNANTVVDVASDGSPVVVGFVESEEDDQVVTSKINATNGSVTWSRAIDGQGDENAYGMAVGPTGEIVTVGWMSEFSEVVSRSVTPLTGSGVNVLVINRSDLSGDTLTTSWLVAGTGITGTIGVNAINVYTGLTGTVRQGSGATFNIIDNGNGTYSAGIETGGTNYLPGHKIKILGSALGGNTPDNDIIITVDSITGSGIIDGVSNSGTAATTSYSSSFGDYSAGGVIVTEVGSSILIVNANLWSASSVNMTALLSGTVMNIEYFGTDNYQLTLTSGFVYNSGQDRYEATFTSLTPTPPAPIDGFVTAISYGVSATYNELTGTNYQTGSGLTFDLELDSGSTYTEHPFNITAAGTNYVTGDVVTISGALLGGTSPANDLTTTVSTDAGGVTTFNTFTGTQQTTTYRVRTDDEGIDFGGVGTWTLSGISVDTDDRMLIVKYNSAGAIQWQKAVQVEVGYDCSGADADIDSEGNIYVCGNYDNVDGQAMIIIKFNSQGVKQWTRQLTGDCYDFATSIVVGPDNFLYLSAVTVNQANDNVNMVIAKYDTDGDVEWQRLLSNTTNAVFAGEFFINNDGGSNLAVKDGYVAVGGGFGDIENFPYSLPNAIVAQVGSHGAEFLAGNFEFEVAGFSGNLDSDASNITVVDAGKTDSDFAGEFTVSDFNPTVDLTSDLIGTLYYGSGGENRLFNSGQSLILETTGAVTLPKGGTITEGVVTSNPTIQLTPARPDVASQKLVIKGGAGPLFTTVANNNIQLEWSDTTAIVGDTVNFTIVDSTTYANQTLYWWLHPTGVGIGDSDFGTVAIDVNGDGAFSILIDSDDYEFTVRVSPENNNYDPDNLGVESYLINASAPTYEDYHLHLTTGDLTETSIFLGTDDHNVRTNTDGTIQVTTTYYGAVGSIGFINSSGGYITGTYTGLTTTGGTGSGLTVDATSTGGTIDVITVVNPGKGYTDDDVITLVGGDEGALGCTFVINVPTGISEWQFNAGGTVTFPTLTVPLEDNANPTGTGQVLQFGDSTQQAIIFGPVSTATNTSAERVIIQGAPGYVGTTGEGGDVYVWAGPGGSTNGQGGDIKIRAGQGIGSGNGGYLNFQAGDSATGDGGWINIESGYSNTQGQGGDITVQARRGGEIILRTDNGTTNLNWTFGADGNLTLPKASKVSEVTPATGPAPSIYPTPGISSIPNEDFVTTPPPAVNNYTIPGTDIVINMTFGANGANYYGPTATIVNGGSGHTSDESLMIPYADMGIDLSGNWEWFVNAIASNLVLEAGTKDWTFGTDGRLTLPGALVKSTVAKTGVILPTTTGVVNGLTHDSVLTGLTDNTYGPFTLSGVTFSVFVFGGVINSAQSISSTGTATVNDVLGTIDSGVIGGTAGTTITWTVDTVVQETPTAIDLTKSINKLTSGFYTLADGVEGQIMYLVPQNGITVAGNVGVSVANFRTSDFTGAGGALLPFRIYNGVDVIDSTGLCTLIFTDSAWQQTGGAWD